MTDVLEQARAWLAEDPDQDTRAELADVLERAEAGDSAALADLGDRFAGPLEFGTAGLRGALGAGPNRMNRVVVIRAAAGLASYLRAHGGESVVIGFDARHKSDVFARDTAAVMLGAGLRAYVLPRPLPTPVLAYAIRHLDVDAGVMVTASHNPPQDNGYKVYLGDGSQIVPPADIEISAAIDAVGPLAAVPIADSGWRVLEDADVLTPVSGPGRVATRTGRSARAADRVDATTRCWRPGARGSLDTGGIHGASCGRGAGRTGPGVPDGRVPQPRGAGRDRSRARPCARRLMLIS